MHDAVQLQLANYVVCSYTMAGAKISRSKVLVGPCRLGFADDQAKLVKLIGVLDVCLP